MKLNKIYRTMFIILLGITLSLSNVIVGKASSNLPYDTYNYDYWENIVFTPAAYIPDENISGKQLGVGNLSSPQDFCITEDGTIYIADTNNNRIVVITKEWKLVKVIETFDNNGVEDNFSAPTGVCVSDSNTLYVADSNHNRVVALDENGLLVKIISDPKSEILADDFTFIPLKVSVDYADRVYVIAKNMFQGIMTFDEKGDFTGFSGTINVQITTLEKIWRRFSTKAQRAKQELFIPTEFTGIDIDPEGFLYATNVDTEGTQSVRKLNPKGQDIIIKGKSQKVSGDLWFRPAGDYNGASHIADVVVREKGIYSCIDTTRGRIFTYDHEGNILYIFGGLGTQAGTFKTPVAIEAVGDKILVLDADRGEIITFSETEYGSLINDAIGLRYDGDEAAAVEKWKQVLKYDENFELAYVGIGKSYLSAGDNKMAMKYLKLGMNKEYYSIAFKRYRNDILKDNLAYVLTGGIILILVFVVWGKVKKHKEGRDIDD